MVGSVSGLCAVGGSCDPSGCQGIALVDRSETSLSVVACDNLRSLLFHGQMGQADSLRSVMTSPKEKRIDQRVPERSGNSMPTRFASAIKKKPAEAGFVRCLAAL